MGKSKKTKTPKIDPRIMTRPRLDALFERQARGELDLDGLEAAVRALMEEVGQPSLLGALVMRMHGTPEGERETLMSLLSRLKSREVIDYLWQQVKKRGALSLDAKMTALVILKDMGEEVDLRDPSRYFSPRDIKPSDIQAAEDLFRTGMRGLARMLRESRDPAEVEAFMHRLNQMPEQAIDGTGILLEYIKTGEQQATDLEADFLFALAHTTPFPDVQQAAEQALERLAARGVKPVTRAILDLTQERFYAAYMSDPNHPWQQGVTVAWERAGGAIQALVFLLDFGMPWRGALKDAFPTHGMTPREFQRVLVDKPAREMKMYRVRLVRAQATVATAVEANRKYGIPLSKELTEVRHLLDRWVLHPAAAALAADTTQDELGDLPLVPDRSGKPLLIDMRDLERSETAKHWFAEQATEAEDEEAELSDEDEFFSFEEAMTDVQRVHVEQSPTWWAVEWVRDYLASLSPTPDDLDGFDEDLHRISDEWWTLKDWFGYLDKRSEIHSVADLRGFHLSEYLQDEADWDDDHGRSRAETVGDWFAYLAPRHLIPSDLPFLSDLSQILARQDTLTLIPRPEPQGGEIALWYRHAERGEDKHNEPLTYNEWWMALVLERKFKRKWYKCRRELDRKPDAATKLEILDQLERRLAQKPKYLDELTNERPPLPEDYERAERWFDHESVKVTRAW
jgi:hypothetical protein